MIEGLNDMENIIGDKLKAAQIRASQHGKLSDGRGKTPPTVQITTKQ